MPASPSEHATLASLQKRAKDLLALARDPSEQSRATLASSLYDLSHASADLPEGERALATDVILEIIKRAATSVRQQLAERLARDPQAPKVLVMMLARDEISVAFPVLTESEVLDEADLLDIINASPPEHRLGTLQRETLSEKVSSAIVDSRDAQSMRWLVDNPGAKISRSAMEMLVEASHGEPQLQGPLINRSDLPNDLATKMQSFVSDDLRERLVERHRVTAVSPGDTRPEASSVSAAASDADTRALTIAKGLQAAGAITVDLLVKTIRAGKITEFEALFARFNQISLAASRQILSSTTGDALAVALKAHGVPKGTFATIFILTRKARDPGTELSTALARATEAFDRLTTSEAKKRFAALQVAHPEDSAA